MLINQIIQLLNDTLNNLDFPQKEIKVSPSKTPEFGDLSSSLPLMLAKDLNQNPMDIAKTIQSNMNVDIDLINEITISKPGFINFRISNNYYYNILKEILSDNNYGKTDYGNGKTANVEFVSANPTGPLTVGHGRNAVLGDVVSNILEWNGYSVTREYYFNDAGRQMRMLSDSVESRYFE
ncbi:MAG: arginine--tRNA ligase, partial [Candidatus Neomarinimicrobiota bacterium]|nr:arginine--tRNA ligase [Candidatus Neomarinimicrobiota bacterium]